MMGLPGQERSFSVIFSCFDITGECDIIIETKGRTPDYTARVPRYA